WMLPQPRALEILRGHLAGFGSRVEFGVKLVDFSQDGGGVTAKLQHADGHSESLRVRYLAGCDGARGVARPASGVAFASETIDPHAMITADVVIPELEPTHWHMWDQAKGGALWLGPLAKMKDAFQLYAKFESAEPDLSLEALRELVRTRT